MAADDANALYDTAHARWPALGWPREAYHQHLNGEHPAHPADLYLGGAAGHRLDPAWAAIETDLAPGVQKILRGLATADYDLEDLWGEVREKLMSDDNRHAGVIRGTVVPSGTGVPPVDQSPAGGGSEELSDSGITAPPPSEPTPTPDLPDGRRPARIVRYRGKVSLTNYLVLIARNKARDRKRQLVRQGHTGSLDAAAGSDADGRAGLSTATTHADDRAPDPGVHAGIREQAAHLVERLRDARKTLSVHQRVLLRLVYGQGMQQKDAGTLLGKFDPKNPDGWSPFKTSRALTDAKTKLREALGDALNLTEADAAPDLNAAWEQAWQAVWSQETADEATASA